MTIKKPMFPKPRLIRESFLPEKTIEEKASNYRIKKLYENSHFPYVIEKKGLFGWREVHTDGYKYFESLQAASMALFEYLEPVKKDEYYEPDFSLLHKELTIHDDKNNSFTTQP